MSQTPGNQCKNSSELKPATGGCQFHTANAGHQQGFPVPEEVQAHRKQKELLLMYVVLISILAHP